MRWTADARVAERARERTRERWLKQQAQEDATFSGTLVDLAERGRPVGLHTIAGRQHRGTITAVGTDFVLMRTVEHHDVLVPLDAVSYLRPRSAETTGSDDRALTIDILLTEALHELCADRPRVLVVFGGNEQPLAGELRAVGRDVIRVLLDGLDRSVASIPVWSVSEVLST